jgi:hypothetical protein
MIGSHATWTYVFSQGEGARDLAPWFIGVISLAREVKLPRLMKQIPIIAFCDGIDLNPHLHEYQPIVLRVSTSISNSTSPCWKVTQRFHEQTFKILKSVISGPKKNNLWVLISRGRIISCLDDIEFADKLAIPQNNSTYSIRVDLISCFEFFVYSLFSTLEKV